MDTRSMVRMDIVFFLDCFVGPTTVLIHDPCPLGLTMVLPVFHMTSRGVFSHGACLVPGNLVRAWTLRRKSRSRLQLRGQDLLHAHLLGIQNYSVLGSFCFWYGSTPLSRLPPMISVSPRLLQTWFVLQGHAGVLLAADTRHVQFNEIRLDFTASRTPSATCCLNMFCRTARRLEAAFSRVGMHGRSRHTPMRLPEPLVAVLEPFNMNPRFGKRRHHCHLPLTALSFSSGPSNMGRFLNAPSFELTVAARLKGSSATTSSSCLMCKLALGSCLEMRFRRLPAHERPPTPLVM